MEQKPITFFNTNGQNELLVPTWQQRFIRELVYFQDEVIFEEEVPHYGEQVDQDESENSSQDDGTPIASDTLDDVQQGLFSVHQVKELGDNKQKQRLFLTRSTNTTGGIPFVGITWGSTLTIPMGCFKEHFFFLFL